VSEPEVTSDVDAAVAVLRRGGVVGLPTETVYGLAAMASNPEAVRRIFAIKGRPSDHPLIVHLPDASHLDNWAVNIPEVARRLAAELWPGPLTLVLPAAPSVPTEVTGGRPTVAVRVPAHPMALAVLRGVGEGLAAPSANRFGAVSPTRADHVVADLGGDVDLVLDGGSCDVGVESTIVDFSGAEPCVLRTGAIPVARLAAIVGGPVPTETGGPARAPGMLAAHYAPRAQVVMTGPDHPVTLTTPAGASPRVAVLAGTTDEVLEVASLLAAAGMADVVELEPVGDAAGFAQRLYDRMRQADRLGCTHLVVVPPPAGGLGDAVRDRLARAAVGSAGSAGSGGSATGA